MKKVLVAILLVFTVLLPSPAYGETACVLNVIDIKVCGPLVTPLPTVTILPNPIQLPGKTITLRPAPVTVTVPSQTKTVVIPGPTSTVTVHSNTTRASAGQPEAPTATVTTNPKSGQTPPSHDTVSEAPEPPKHSVVHETRTKTETIVRTVLAGTLVTLLLVGLGILALFLGYILGQRDAAKEEDDFLRSLVAQVRGEKH